MIKKLKLLLLVFTASLSTAFAQDVRYSPAWFGPNANPVPEFSSAIIPATTQLRVMGDVYFGGGDNTQNAYIDLEMPLLSERVSVRVWTALLERYEVSEAVATERGMAAPYSGNAMGDFYVQTRISLLKESRYQPAMVLNLTMKTASGTQFKYRRYFDTPGYYFSVDMGKSFQLPTTRLLNIRLGAQLGFMSWETSGSRQNDAPMYGLKASLFNPQWQIDNTLSGYWGWMHTHPNYGADYGDTPLVYALKITRNTYKLNYFIQYQYGIKDYPYHQIRVGMQIPLPRLTPDFK